MALDGGRCSAQAAGQLAWAPEKRRASRLAVAMLCVMCALAAQAPAACGGPTPQTATSGPGFQAGKPFSAASISKRSRTLRASSIVDDPHFSSPDGVPFDFHGHLHKAYCLTSDARLHINALLDGYQDSPPAASATVSTSASLGATLASQGSTPASLAATSGASHNRTWMKELGVLWVDPRGVPHRLHLVARTNQRRADRMHGYLERVSLDGHVLKAPYDGRRIEKGPMLLQFTGVLRMPRGEEQESFSLSIGGLLGASLILRPAKRTHRTPLDAHVHFNLHFFSLNTTERVHGILGQTYRSSRAQEAKAKKFLRQVQRERRPVQADLPSRDGFLDGNAEDYEASGVTKPDCKFSTFQAGLSVK